MGFYSRIERSWLTVGASQAQNDRVSDVLYGAALMLAVGVDSVYDVESACYLSFYDRRFPRFLFAIRRFLFGQSVVPFRCPFANHEALHRWLRQWRSSDPWEGLPWLYGYGLYGNSSVKRVGLTSDHPADLERLKRVLLGKPRRTAQGGIRGASPAIWLQEAYGLAREQVLEAARTGLPVPLPATFQEEHLKLTLIPEQATGAGVPGELQRFVDIHIYDAALRPKFVADRYERYVHGLDDSMRGLSSQGFVGGVTFSLLTEPLPHVVISVEHPWPGRYLVEAAVKEAIRQAAAQVGRSRRQRPFQALRLWATSALIDSAGLNNRRALEQWDHFIRKLTSIDLGIAQPPTWGFERTSETHQTETRLADERRKYLQPTVTAFKTLLHPAAPHEPF